MTELLCPLNDVSCKPESFPVVYGNVGPWIRKSRSNQAISGTSDVMVPHSVPDNMCDGIDVFLSSVDEHPMDKPEETFAVQEPQLTSDDDGTRFCLYPIRYPDIFDFYKKHQMTFWTASEIDFSLDITDWNQKLTAPERYFIEHILAFFAGSDGIVLENLVTNFCREITLPEARCFYAFQAMMENVHSEVYSLMIDTFIQDTDRKHVLFHAIQQIPCVKQKSDWSLRWIDPGNSLATRLLAFIIVEGLFFSGSFCSIFWLKERGLMVHSLGKSNEWIARDEGLHQCFGIHLYNHYIQHKLAEEIVHTMMRDAVHIETNFITVSLPVRLIGMNHELMIQYIQYVADHILSQLSYHKLYHVSNPFAFMEKIGLDGKTNFFEQRVSEYTVGHENKLNGSSFDLSIIQDDDF